MKKSTLITIAVIIVLAIGGIRVSNVFAKQDVKVEKTEEQIFIEAKAEHAKYEYETLQKKIELKDAEEREEQALKEFWNVREKTLGRLNWTWQGFQK